MSRTTGVTKTKIRKLLNECAFAPTEYGPMRIVADVGDPAYYTRRAREELLQVTPNLKFAIQLLALALAERDANEEAASPS